MRIRTRSLVILLGNGAYQSATLILSVVLVRIISQETFGTYRQVLLVYTTLFALLSLQLDTTLYYFVPRSIGNARRRLALQTSALSAALGFVTGGLMFFSAGMIASFFENKDLTTPLRVFSLFPIADGLTILTPAFMASVDRAVRAAVYGMLRALLRLVVVIPAFLAGAELESVLAMVVGVTFLLALAGIVDMVWLSRGKSETKIPAGWRDQVGYALPLWLASVAGIMNLQYDKLLISVAFDPVMYAVYFCGALQIPVVALVHRSLSAATMPNLVAMAESGRRREALDLWQEATRKAGLVILPTFGFLLVVSQELMLFLYGPDYQDAAGPFTVYLFLLPLRIAVFATLFRAFGRTRPIAVGGVLSFMSNVAISTTLVYGAYGSYLAFIGPSIGTVASHLISAVYLLSGLRRLAGVDLSQILRWRELGELLALSAGSGVLAYLLPLGEQPLVVELLGRAAAYGCAFVLGLVGFGLLRDDEKTMIRNWLRSIGIRSRDGV